MSEQNKVEVENKETDELNEKIKVVAAAIQAVLESNGMALQPFLSFSEYGVAPRVRLVENKIETKNEETGNTGEGEVTGDTDTDTGAVQS